MKPHISIQIPELSLEQESLLGAFGLSDHEHLVYRLLVTTGVPMSAQDVATKIMIFPNAVYRIFKTLEATGLIRYVGRGPIRYEALQLEQGLTAAYLHRKNELDQMLQLATKSTVLDGAQTYTIVGRDRMYQEYIHMAEAAKKEIGVFAIGIAFSDTLYSVQQAAIKRGVYIRHIVQQLQPDNYHIIAKWKRLGVNIRHFNEDRGFHLTLIDKTTAMVTFSDPGNTEDRFSVITHQPFAVKMFQAQFESIWQAAREVDTLSEKVKVNYYDISNTD